MRGRLVHTILLILIFLTALAQSLLTPILPIYLRTIVYSIALVGLLVSLSGILRIVASFSSGILSAKVGRSKLLRVALAFSSVGILVHVVKNVAVILVGRVLTGFFSPITASLLLSYATEVGSALRRAGKYMSTVNLLSTIAMIVDPLASGLLSQAFGMGPVFITSAALLATCTLLVGKLVRLESNICDNYTTKNAMRNFTLLIRIRRLLYTYCLAFVETYILVAFFMILPLHLQYIGFDILTIGSLMAFEAVIYAISQFIMGHLRDRLNQKANLLMVLSLLRCLALMLMVYYHNIVSIVISLALFALGSSPIIPNVLVNLSKYTPKHLHTFSTGIYYMFTYIASFLGPLTTGFIADISLGLGLVHMAFLTLTILPLAVLLAR